MRLTFWFLALGLITVVALTSSCAKPDSQDFSVSGQTIKIDVKKK